MDEESGNTPTALVKIFGDFDSRVRTASRRTYEGRNPSGSSYSSAFKSSYSSHSKPPKAAAAPFARLLFDDTNDSPHRQHQHGVKRTSSVLDDPLSGLDRYPKAKKSDDSKNSQTEVNRLKMQLIQKEADIVSLESEIKQGQAVVKKMELEVARDRLARENERELQIRQMRNDRERIEDLESKVAALTKRKAYDQEYQDLRTLPSRRQSHVDESQIESLTEELIHAKDELFSVKSEMHEREAQYEEQLASLQSMNEELQERIYRAESEPEKSSAVKQELEKVKGDLVIALQDLKKSQSDLQALEDDRLQHKIMRNKLDKHATLEKEVDHLRLENKLLNETADNATLLRQQIEDLTQRLAETEESLNESRMKERELHYVERQSKQWKHLCWKLLNQSEREKMGDKIGPDILAAKIAGFQQQILEQAEQIETEKNEAKQQQATTVRLEKTLAELLEKSKLDGQNLNEQANLIKRFKRKLLLVSKERDSYKGVLESYEHELTFNGAAFEKDRVSAMENALKDYSSTVERLEDLLAAARSTKDSHETEQALNQEISNLKNRIGQLERENVAIMQQKQGTTSGQDEGQSERVMHFLNNPLSQATDARKREVEDLKAEVVALKARIKLLEEGQTKDLTMLVGQKVSEDGSEEIAQLKEQLKSAEIRKQRLIEAFKKTSQDFREVCYVLTGFRIDGLNDGKYRLSPVYAETADEYLLFKREPSGECLLLETEYSAQEHVQKLIQLHLQRQNSIPVFLAAVITDLFSRQTFDPAPQYEEEEIVEEEEEEEGEDEDERDPEEDEDESVSESGDNEEEEREDDHREEEDDGDDDDDDDDIVCID